MESYGQILKKAREAKNIDIQKAAGDTSISDLYIKALEEEDEKVFPGEPYLYGFLKNYADYLGVDSSTVTVLYKNKKIQEADTPADLLFTPKKDVPVLLIAGCIAGFLLIAAVVLFFTVFRKSASGKDGTVAVDGRQEVHQYTLDGKSFSKRLYKGDQILVPSGTGNVILTVAGTLGTFKFETPAGLQQIELSEELPVDLNNDAAADLIVYVSDISLRDESRGAEVSMIWKNGAVSEAVPAAEDLSAAVPAVVDLKIEQTKKVLLSDTRAYPFSINTTFRGACMFRYAVDNSDSVESYYTSGEVVSMTPKNGVRIWISNGTAARLQMIVNGQATNLDVGKAGQVLVIDIKWIKDSDGLYKVVIIDVD